MDISNNEITESQLEELDELLIELNKPIENSHPDFLGDDELMIDYMSKLKEKNYVLEL